MTTTVTSKKTTLNVSADDTDILLSEADKIWSEIKNKEILMFALPSQTVANYCTPATVEPSKLYLLATAGSVLPALELAIGSEYKVNVVTKYLTVERSVK